jgi:alcohol dehydrogenase class IV
MAAVAKGNYAKFTAMGEAMGICCAGLTPAEAAGRIVGEIEQMYRDIGIPLTLRGLNVGITENDLDRLTDEAYSQKRVMGHSMYQFTRDEVLAIFKAAY